MSTELALLRRVASRSETEADRQALADRLHTYLTTSEPLSLDAVFGLASLPGRPSWRRVDALDRRDAAFRAIARRYYHGLPVATQARDIRAAMVAYASTSWRFDSRSIMPPKRYIDSEREMLFDAMKALPVVPSERHLRRILTP